jgi:hypothetical protein
MAETQATIVVHAALLEQVALLPQQVCCMHASHAAGLQAMSPQVDVPPSPAEPPVPEPPPGPPGFPHFAPASHSAIWGGSVIAWEQPTSRIAAQAPFDMAESVKAPPPGGK